MSFFRFSQPQLCEQVTNLANCKGNGSAAFTPDPAGAVPEPAWPEGPDIPGQHPRSIRLDPSVPRNVVGPELPGNLTLEGRRMRRAVHTTPRLSLLEAH